VIADTLNSRVLWLDQPGPGNSTRVLAKLDVGHPEWEGLRYPNNVQRLEIEGRDHLLTTFKSGDFPEVARDNTGRIVLWDIEDLEDIRRVWRYPEEGFLAAVHHGQVFDTPSGPLLVYAHSAGASEGFVGGLHGSVGLARFNGLEPPTYLADGLADPLEVEPFGFLREAEILEDGAALLVTDSGCENQSAACVSDGRVMSFRLPALEPSGTSGAFTATHETQTFVSLENFGHVFAWGMKFPFEADLLRGEAQLATWGRPGVGFCEGEVGSDTSSDTGWESMEPLPRGEEVSP
jgi:hypothetical protein